MGHRAWGMGHGAWGIGHGHGHGHGCYSFHVPLSPCSLPPAFLSLIAVGISVTRYGAIFTSTSNIATNCVRIN